MLRDCSLKKERDIFLVNSSTLQKIIALYCNLILITQQKQIVQMSTEKVGENSDKQTQMGY